MFAPVIYRVKVQALLRCNRLCPPPVAKVQQRLCAMTHTPVAPNLAYADFKYEDYRFQKSVLVTEDYSGKAVAGVAKFVGNLGIDITTKPGLYANANYLYKDGMPISSDGLNKTTSYNLLNAKLGFQKSWCSHFDTDVFFGVNNITGTQYAYMVFVNQLPDAYLPAPYKANYFGGVNLKYNF